MLIAGKVKAHWLATSKRLITKNKKPEAFASGFLLGTISKHLAGCFDSV